LKCVLLASVMMINHVSDLFILDRLRTPKHIYNQRQRWNSDAVFTKTLIEACIRFPAATPVDDFK